MCFREEADEYVDIGALNGIFVLGRSMGFIGELAVVLRVSCYAPCPVCVNLQKRCHSPHRHLLFLIIVWVRVTWRSMSLFLILI